MLNFTNAQLLSLSIENQFFGESFRYQSQKRISVRGSLYNLTNQEGVSGIWSGIMGKLSEANDYDDIQLRGVSFGRGRVESLKFEVGVDVRIKPFTVELTVFDTGNLFNMTGEYYNGVDMSMASRLESFSESFNFSVDTNHTYTYEHNVACRFVATGGSTNTIPLAKAFASGLLTTSPAFGFINEDFSGFYNEPGKRTYKENYNLITSECSFTENFKMPASGTGAYVIDFGYTLSTDEKGVSSVTERATIQGLYEPISGSAEQGYQDYIGGAYARCSGEFDYYQPSGAYDLNNSKLSSSKKIDAFNGTIEFSTTYNNDPRYLTSPNYSWEYQQEIRREYCNYTVQEDGTVRGISSNCTYADRYANASGGYNVVKSGFYPRNQAFATSGGAGTLRQVSLSEERSVFNGEIQYKVGYTDSLASTSSPTIRKVEVETTDDMPVALVNKFVALGFGGTRGFEGIQYAKIPTPGQKSVQVRVYGFRTTDRADLIETGRYELNQHAPSGVTDPFIASCGYSFESGTNTINAHANWTYFADWGFDDIDV